MKVLLVKQPGTDLSKYHAILDTRGVEYEDIEQPITGDILTSDEAKVQWCATFYQQYKETVDAVQFFLPLEDWPERRTLLGRMRNRYFSGYLTSCTRMRSGYEKTAEHELLHKVDNWVKTYLGISIERILGISDWDDVVVHGDVPGDQYTEYNYDQAWKDIQPYLNEALVKRKHEALLGYFEQLLIALRKMIIQLEDKLCTIKGMNHPVPAARISYKYGVPDDAYSLTKHHIGTDYAVPVGTPVEAPHDGEIVVAGVSRSLGNFCHYRYTHEGQQYVMRFLHLQSVPKQGEYEAGDIIAKTGNTGMSTGPHLHIDIWKDEVRLDLINEHNWKDMLVDPEIHLA